VGKWQVRNIAEGTVRGVETQAGWRHPRGHRLAVGWSWLENDTKVDPDFVGKYTLLVPRHLWTAQGTVVLPANLVFTATGRYVEHNQGTDEFDSDLVDFLHYFVLDARLDWTGPHGWFAAATGSNLLDRVYGEVPGVQMPGALLTGTLGKRF
jgi:outer membrane receptor protein involved in Fe transport